ncbi:cerebellin-2-like [Oratosquilla oratoria]|uniref:cerebellin-2-like n=1 Tax=Oratosquilla oratoria TaxID=337810 RepID=UPI003F764F45
MVLFKNIEALTSTVIFVVVVFCPQGTHALISALSDPTAFGPCNAGFTVRRANNDSLVAPAHIGFAEVVTNLGGWDATGQHFTAPCHGAYFFLFHATSTKEEDFTMAIMHNGEYRVTAYGSSKDFQAASNSAVLYLNRFDNVHLQLQQGRIYEHALDNEAYTTFTAFRIA